MLSQRLRHRIELQERVEIVSTAGESQGFEWRTADADGALLDDVPSEVLTGPGREFRAADAKQAETAARITLRWFSGLSPTWRVLWEGQTFDITSIDVDLTGRREYRLRCAAGVNDGA